MFDQFVKIFFWGGGGESKKENPKKRIQSLCNTV